MSDVMKHPGSATPGTARNNNISFGVCVLVLTLSIVVLTTAKAKGWLQLIKKAAPLKEKFDFLKADGPLKMEIAQRYPPEMEAELGTVDYATWLCRREKLEARAPGSEFVVHVSYYTGKPDQVPHIPEECVTQGGGAMEVLKDVTLELPGRGYPGAQAANVEVRRIVFQNPTSVVYYLFSVNGTYCVDRNTVRRLMLNPSETYLYYSKVELSFRLASPKDADNPAIEESVVATLDWLLPKLASEHWPDVAAMNAEAAK